MASIHATGSTAALRLLVVALRRAAVLGLVLPYLLPGAANAQGDGPRVYPLAPVGLNVASVTYMHFSSNYNFQQSIQITNASINSDVVAVSYVRMFRIGGRMAQLWVTPIWGSVGGSLQADPSSGLPANVDVPPVSGFADPYTAFRVGLIGAPALTLSEFAKHRAGFQLYALTGISVPVGDYVSTRPLNLGTNRWAFRLAAPMAWPLLKPAHQLLLELVPSIYFYTDNNAPFGVASVRSQDPLFVAEGHVSYNLSRRLWAAGNLRYQLGGETFSDGVPDDNRAAHLGGGADVGYQVLRPLTIFAGFGAILAESDRSRGTMLRVRANLVF